MSLISVLRWILSFGISVVDGLVKVYLSWLLRDLDDWATYCTTWDIKAAG